MKIVALRLENQQPRELSANKAAPIKPSSRLRFLTIREACMGGLTKVTCAGDRSELSIAETVCRARREFGGPQCFQNRILCSSCSSNWLAGITRKRSEFAIHKS